MSIFQNITFSFSELLAILGLGQALLILVHVILRLTTWRVALPYMAYFMMLSLGFVLNLSYRLDDFHYEIDYLSWFVWSMTTPLSILIILLTIKGAEKLNPWRYSIVLLQPLCAFTAVYAAYFYESCTRGFVCYEAFGFHFAAGVIAQCLAFGYFWNVDVSIVRFKKQPNYSERYWLVICLLVVNIMLIGLSLWYLNDASVTLESLSIARIMLGLVFIYIMSTMMFRVYPYALELKGAVNGSDDLSLSRQDLFFKSEIEKLMQYDKLYQEPNYSRSDLAQELKIPEATVSNIISTAFGVGFPQYVNGFRIAEAKYLLQTTTYAVKSIAEMTGFNSIASFNRVFKDIVGMTPRQFRNKHIKNKK